MAPPPWHIESTMLLITCPWCGPRDENEFQYGGEAHIARPKDPAALSDAEWADYLFMRKNPKGKHRERWMHRSGCRRWFNAERDTVSHAITAIYKIGEKPPAAPTKDAPASTNEPGSNDPGNWPAGGGS
jgi:heterotetrameric sarcosine oxidase delta subunit